MITSPLSRIHGLAGIFGATLSFSLLASLSASPAHAQYTDTSDVSGDRGRRYDGFPRNDGLGRNDGFTAGPGVQILSDRSLELSVPRPTRAKAQDTVQVSVVFPDSKRRHQESESALLGSVQMDKDSGTFKLNVDAQVFADLKSRHHHSLATLKFEVDGKDVGGKASAAPQLYVGGDFDRDCEYPVLISDFNGTLDRGDSCTKQNLDEFVQRNELTVFVVSTLGTSIGSELDRVGLKNRSRFAVLASMSAGENSFGESGPTEKALRVASSLFPAGACVLGMAGDTPSTDGGAANMLKIPYLAANQKAFRPQIGVNKVKDGESKSCELKYERLYIQNNPKDGCAKGFQSSPYTAWECVKRTLTIEGRTNEEIKWIANPVNTGSPCEREGLQTKSGKRDVLGCSTDLPKVREPFRNRVYGGAPANGGYVGPGISNGGYVRGGNSEEPIGGTGRVVGGGRVAPADKEEPCDEPYAWKVSDLTHDEPVYGDARPSLDISKYATGSVYSEDWCQLITELEKRIKK